MGQPVLSTISGNLLVRPRKQVHLAVALDRRPDGKYTLVKSTDEKQGDNKWVLPGGYMRIRSSSARWGSIRDAYRDKTGFTGSIERCVAFFIDSANANRVVIAYELSDSRLSLVRMDDYFERPSYRRILFTARDIAQNVDVANNARRIVEWYESHRGQTSAAIPLIRI